MAPAEVPPSPVVTTVSDNNAPATELPALPPGTAPHVVEAVQSSFDQGTLTQQEAEAVSQLYAPLYNPTVEIPYEVRDSSGVVVSTTATVVDFGTAEAAQAALDAYYNNFVGAPPPEPEPAPTTGSSDGGQSDVDAYLASLGY